MADRALRGMQIGSKSMESEEGVVFADRVTARYICPNGHEFEVPFSTEATPPEIWDCKCGIEAEIIGDAPVEDDESKCIKIQRTHWDMVRERRSMDELQVLLDEQLKALNEGRLRAGFFYRNS